MLNIRQELANIHRQIHKAYYQCSVLGTIVTDPHESNPLFSGEMDKLVSGLEKTVMHARYLNEACYMDIQPLDKTAMDYERHWSKNMAGGKVEVDANGWLHITLGTLLPHCKYQSSPYLKDTLIRLLSNYQQSGGALPPQCPQVFLYRTRLWSSLWSWLKLTSLSCVAVCRLMGIWTRPKEIALFAAGIILTSCFCFLLVFAGSRKI